MTPTEQKALLQWYRANRRDLPWRKNRDAYRVWISETMLQQTTTTAVLGYYDRFLARFPTLTDLAHARIEEVYALWAGLGYYSRARNLHRAAQMLNELPSFPQTHQKLLAYPGFGPYTARAVSSIAFSDPVGVLDGNVIRVMSRKDGLAVEWWRPSVRDQLQKQVDSFVKDGPSHELNQALMELGSQICTPKSPHCIQCPWLGRCTAQKTKKVELLPLKKPRKANEIWLWEVAVVKHQDQLLICKNDYAPFLKKSWLLPGEARRVKSRPANYDFRHSITHHDIFVRVRKQKRGTRKPSKDNSSARWIERQELSHYVPATLVKKAVDLVWSPRAK